MKELVISKRLSKIAGYIEKGARLADIGSDHAYLPCYAAIHGLIQSGIAGELNEGPYLSACETVREFGLNDKIAVRRGDGLSVIKKGEANTVVIAGMGGELIRTILDAGKDKLTSDTVLILQPNVAERHLREWLDQEGWGIEKEDILEEDGHIYEILVANKQHTTASKLSNIDLLFGPFLRKEKSEIFIRKWKSERDKRLRVLRSMNKAKEPHLVDEKKAELQNEIQLIEEVIKA